MKTKTVTLPSEGTEVTIRKPGPVTIERALGYLPICIPELQEPKPMAAGSAVADEAAVEKMVDVIQKDLRFARELICLCAVKPKFTADLEAPKGSRSIEELDFRDYWFLFMQLFEWSGVDTMKEVLRPTSPTGSEPQPTTPSAGDTDSGPARSSDLSSPGILSPLSASTLPA